MEIKCKWYIYIFLRSLATTLCAIFTKEEMNVLAHRKQKSTVVYGPLAWDMFSILHQLKSNFLCCRAVTGRDNRETALRCDHNAAQSWLIIFYLESWLLEFQNVSCSDKFNQVAPHLPALYFSPLKSIGAVTRHSSLWIPNWSWRTCVCVCVPVRVDLFDLPVPSCPECFPAPADEEEQTWNKPANNWLQAASVDCTHTNGPHTKRFVIFFFFCFSIRSYSYPSNTTPAHANLRSHCAEVGGCVCSLVK